MAHVHGAKTVATAAKAAEEVCPLMAAETAKSGMSMGGMMGHGMGEMMGGMMQHGTRTAAGSMMNHGAMAASGAAVTAAATAQHSLLRRVLTHPLVLFGAGVAIGYLIHQYREEILRGSVDTVE